MRTPLKIGLFGLGCVGTGLYEVLHKSAGIKAEIVKICVKQKNKPRAVPMEFFTYDAEEILSNPEINLVVELIDHSEEAFKIVSEAMRRGKGVVTANKKMVADHFEELYLLQQEYKVPFLYEASVCGSIPILRNLEEYYNNDYVSGIDTICNGTCNYILTRTIEEGLSYGDALSSAKELGFAESNPKLDVEAFDALYKLLILVVHTFGSILKPQDIFNYGITHLHENDIQYAKEKGYAIRLLARTQRVNGSFYAYVAPHFVRSESAFFGIRNEMNAVQVQALFSDSQLFTGKGAGSYPTASAVLSDISALSYAYRYEYKKIEQNLGLSFTNEVSVKIYARFTSEVALSELQMESIDERYQSHGYQYVVGKTSLSILKSLNLNDRSDLFIAVLPN